MSSALTLSFEDDVLSRLDAAAADRQVSREQLAADIVVAYLDDENEFEEWQLAKIRAGQAAAARGDFASEAEVEKFFSQYR